MIGPSSGASDMPKREVDENPVRAKRKIFEDLDIDSFCDEVCQSAKKCNSMECDGLDMSDIVQFPSSSSTPLQETANSGSVGKFEVFVVDGPWDVSNLSGSELIDISSTIDQNSEISIGQSVENIMQNIDNGYGTILSYWESAAENIGHGMSMIENEEQQSELPELCSSPVPNPAASMTCNPSEDQENGNLSWLLDFKLDSFIEAPEEKGPVSFPKNNQTGPKIRNQSNNIPYVNDVPGNNNNEKDESAYPQTPMSSSYSSTANRNFSVSRYGGPKKPPFTYTELIEHALKEKGELTVSAIYQWISEHFPYYKSNDDRWKNSVRHNLSINPHFRKGSKAPHGAGHLWAIANRGDTRPGQLILQNAAAVPTIQRQVPKNTPDSSHSRKSATNDNLTRRVLPMDEVALATASISQTLDENEFISVTLEHCAEQILNGIKKDVEVQYLVPMMTMQNNTQPESNQLIPKIQTTCLEKETDFLNPVSKEVVAEECGLISESYLVTDLNSSTLGLSLAESEISTSENLFGEELSFQFYELTSPSQIQST